jgi:hypothetical protein
MFFGKLSKTRPARTGRPLSRRTTLRIETLEGRDLMSGFTPVGPAPISQRFSPPIPAPAVDTEGNALAPFALTAKAVSPTEIDLSWKSNAKPGSAAYRFDICENIGGVWKEIAVTNQSTTWQVTGLQGGTGYQFKVGTPDTQFGNGEDYSETVGKTTPVSVPAAPTGVAASEISSSTAQLKWNGVAGATAYIVYYWTGSQWQPLGSTSGTSVTITHLAPGHPYYFAVAAQNAAGPGPLSAYAAITVR